MQAEAVLRNTLSSKWCNNKASDIKLVYLYSTNRCTLYQVYKSFKFTLKLTSNIFIVNFNYLYSRYKVHPLVNEKKNLMVSRCTTQQ